MGVYTNITSGLKFLCDDDDDDSVDDFQAISLFLWGLSILRAKIISYISDPIIVKDTWHRILINIPYFKIIRHLSMNLNRIFQNIFEINHIIERKTFFYNPMTYLY